MKTSIATKTIAACALLTASVASYAHIVLSEPAALAGTSYRATLRVGHGCDGSPVTALRVTLPAGFMGAKPMPKAGWLPDAYYDEFVLRGGLPSTTEPMWFKVKQTCEKGNIDWAETPAAGTSTHGLKYPAALLEIIESGPAGHAH
jgi:uncharacterized protein YcnI